MEAMCTENEAKFIHDRIAKKLSIVSGFDVEFGGRKNRPSNLDVNRPSAIEI